MRKILINIALICLVAFVSQAATLRQMRGARLDTRRGAVWPALYSDADSQLADLDALLDRFVRSNLNTVFIDLQHDGSVLWLSDRQPAAYEVTADGSRRLPYDVAGEVIDRAHRRGLQVVAVVSPLDIGTRANSSLYLDSPIAHPLTAEAELLLPEADADGRYFLDPALGATREYLEELYTELIAGYDIDGLMIDRLYAPGADPTQLTTIIDDIAALIDTHRPEAWLAIGETSLAPEQADSHADFILSSATQRDILTQLRDAAESAPAYKRLVGIDGSRLFPLIDALRHVDELPLAGFVVNNPQELPLNPMLFEFPAHIPELSWREGEQPAPPEDFEVEYDAERGSYLLNWSEPSLDKYATPIKYYTIYIARDGRTDLTDPRGEIIHAVRTTEVEIPSTIPGLEFAATAFDANYRESLPALAGSADPLAEAMHPWIFRYYAGTLDIGAPVEIDAVDIYNSWGNHIRHLSTAPANEVMIDVYDLPSGVYVVHLHHVDGSVRTHKFIK